MNITKTNIGCKLLLSIFLLFCLSNYWPTYGQAAKRAPFTEAEQEKFLKTRVRSGSMTGSFASMGSLLFAVVDVIIHSDDQEVNDIGLNSPFPEYYKPTWAEYFDEIARQTRSTWKYDAARGYWVFNKPSLPPAFKIDIVNGWTAHDEGAYIGYKPPSAPVGMDIYMLGRYSIDKPGDKVLFDQVRESLALLFAGNFKKDVTIKDMQKVIIADTEAYYFQSTTPRPGYSWRQWIFIKNGRAFAIVSVLSDKDKNLLNDVEAMIKTFKL